MTDIYSRLKSVFVSHKKTVTKQAIGIVCLGVLFVAGSGAVLAEAKTSSLETIYHIYVDGKRIGSVEDIHTYETIVEKKIESYKEQYEALNLVLGQDVKVIPERVFQARTDSEKTLAELNELLTIKAKATALTVDDTPVLYVGEDVNADELLKAYQLQYVSEPDLQAYNNKVAAGVKDADQLPAVNERKIRSIRLSKEVQSKEALAAPEEILTTERAIEQLKLGAAKDDIYAVKSGDVLGSISKAHKLTIKELINLNEGVSENTVLQIGQELRVKKFEPLVTVLVDQAKTIEEEIPFQTETKEDSSLWKGDTKIAQEGKPGKRIVSYELSYENGREIKREIVKDEVTEQAVNRIVVKGTKESPSRGTGKLSWPAVGGYISSYQGNRWGRFHKGIDIARPSNYNILAADNGKVTFAGREGGYGNMVKINHNNGIVTVYAHLQSIDVSVGQTVSSGEKIGVMGSTGNSTGTHLHFEVYKNGDLENPMDYLK